MAAQVCGALSHSSVAVAVAPVDSIRKCSLVGFASPAGGGQTGKLGELPAGGGEERDSSVATAAPATAPAAADARQSCNVRGSTLLLEAMPFVFFPSIC